MSKTGSDPTSCSASSSTPTSYFEQLYGVSDIPSEFLPTNYKDHLKLKRTKAGDDYDLPDNFATSSKTSSKMKVTFSISDPVSEDVAGPSSSSHKEPLKFAVNQEEEQEEEGDTPVPTSHFSDKLHTNYIPSFPEIQQIRRYVLAVDDKLAHYDAEMARLSAALHELSTKRNQLHDIRTAHCALASPVRRLPPEILQVIFAWCLPDTRNCVMHASEAPVLLGRVCSGWRRIALATPEVWASLHIVPPNMSYTNPDASASRFKRKRELVKMWLGRSGACPLSVSMVWFAGDSEDEVKLCGSLLGVLAPLCGRWRVLDFQVPLKMFSPFAGLSAADVPLLEGITLMDNRTPADSDAVDRWPESLNFAESASRLRTFTLTFFSGGIRLPAIPWPQLTTLYLESNIAFFFTDSREMLSTLALCSHLTNCTLKFPLSHTASLPTYEPYETTVLLPQLEALCLDGDQHLPNTFHMNTTLSSLCVPKLRRLEILGRVGRPESVAVPEPFAALRVMLQKSRCLLEKLTLESITMVPEEFVGCLKMVPGLKELVVQNWTARVFTAAPIAAVTAGGGGEEAREADVADVAENKILLALTVCPKKEQDRLPVDVDVVETKPDEDEAEESAKTEDDADANAPPPPPPPEDTSPLCPNLQRIDFTLCNASQRLLCDFVASRWEPPAGVARLQAVKSNFTAFEDDAVKACMEKFVREGLHVDLTYQLPVSDDYSPSPWTGLEGAPGT